MTRMANTAALTLVLTLTALGGCKAERRNVVAQPPPPPPVTQPSVANGAVDGAELLVMLQQQNADEMSALLNDAKRRGLTERALQELQSVWMEGAAAHRDLSWQVLQEPLIRLDLAEILVQAAANGEIEAAPNDVHAAVVEILRVGPPRVRSKALVSLSLFESAADVPVIEQAASDERNFRGAVIALSRMCVTEAGAALDRLQAGSSGDDREFLVQTRSRMDEYKKHDGVCPRR